MKNNIVFSCSNCGAQFQKWTGRCFECGKWGTIAETKIKAEAENKTGTSNYAPIEMTDLKSIDSKKFARQKTNIEELDRVLGGGLVPGSLILLGGEPGI